MFVSILDHVDEFHTVEDCRLHRILWGLGNPGFCCLGCNEERFFYVCHIGFLRIIHNQLGERSRTEQITGKSIRLILEFLVLRFRHEGTAEDICSRNKVMLKKDMPQFMGNGEAAPGF